MSWSASGDCLVVHAAFTQGFRPFAIGILVSKVQKHDLLAVLMQKLSRVDPTALKPVQVRAELHVWYALERPFQVVLIVRHLVRVVMEVQHHAALIAEADQLA